MSQDPATPELEKTPPETAETKADVTAVETPEAAREARRKARREARRKRKIHHRIVIWTLILLFVLTVASGVAFLAFTGRQIILPDTITQQIEQQINRDLNGPEVSIGQVVTLVERNFVPRVTARNVGFIDASGAEIARFNELRAVLSRDALKEWQLRPDTLRLRGAQITVRRREDGAFSLDFGGAGGLAGSGADVLEGLDKVFSDEPLNTIRTVEARDITVTLEDARSDRIWQATDAVVTLSNTETAVEIGLNFELFNGTEDLSEIELRFTSHKGSLATSVSLNMTDAPTQDFALQSPALSFLSVVEAPVSASMRAEIDGEGLLSSYSGTLSIDAGRINAGQGADPIAFEGAHGYFDYDPERERITFPEIKLSTDALEMTGRGHVLLSEFEGNWPQAFTGQWQFSELKVDPEGMFDAPLVFDTFSTSAKLRLSPFTLDVGEFALERDGVWLRGRGRAAATPEGWVAGLDLNAEELEQSDLLALWPPAAVSKTRLWLADNIKSATYRDLDLAFRFAPGQTKPTLALDWDFDNLDLRFIKTLPNVKGGHGYGAIFDNRLTIAVDGGEVMAPQGGMVDMAGTVLTIPDISVKPARMDIALRTASPIEAGLSLMAEPPFSILREAVFGPDVATGFAELRGQISFPLIQKVMTEDVNFLLTGNLNDVASDQLMPGQVLSADQLRLVVDPSGVAISGAAKIGTAQMSGQWRKNFGPEHRGRSDMTGIARLDQNLLDTFNILLPEGMVSGVSDAALTVALRKGEPPAFSLISDLIGTRLSIPALGWAKASGTQGEFELAGMAGPAPEVTRLEIAGAGLSAEGGAVTLDNGIFRDVSFARLALFDWLDVPVLIESQGPDRPVRISVNGGSIDLTRNTFGAGGGSASVPIVATLDRLTFAKTQYLTGVLAQLTAGPLGVNGDFRGYLNGTGALTGTLSPGAYGPTIQVRSEDAGSVVTASGVLGKAAGGSLAATLTALPEDGGYQGRAEIKNIRVRSASTLAELLSAVSVVGLLDQMASGGGILFSTVQADLTIRPGTITVRDGTAEGPSLGISMEGLYDGAANRLDMQGVISPVYFINALGQVVSRRGEGLFGFTYTLTGPARSPSIMVNPLSILTPGLFREIFRSKPAGEP
ncbi:hypothetical protein LA304_13970 [Celeribacter sp. ASW11-22]|nr:hypothetical protein [Celeribacter litoreus]